LGLAIYLYFCSKPIVVNGIVAATVPRTTKVTILIYSRGIVAATCCKQFIKILLLFLWRRLVFRFARCVWPCVMRRLVRHLLINLFRRQHRCFQSCCFKGLIIAPIYETNWTMSLIMAGLKKNSSSQSYNPLRIPVSKTASQSHKI
ncbi:MAG: hypothetical protein AAB723_00790, partial [Patescibacteria group bacterium]